MKRKVVLFIVALFCLAAIFYIKQGIVAITSVAEPGIKGDLVSSGVIIFLLILISVLEPGCTIRHKSKRRPEHYSYFTVSYRHFKNLLLKSHKKHGVSG